MSHLCYDWIRHHAYATPDKIALIEPDRAVTYAELWQLVGRRAGQLAAFGVGRGERVAALLPNRIAVITLQAACARLGAIFAPLNYRLAPAELGAVIDDAEPSLLFYDERTAGLAQTASATNALLLVDADRPTGDGAAERAEVGPHEPALLIYTSGSTGEPRGVVLTHANLVWNHAQFLEDLPFGSGDVNYCAAPMFHVAGLNVLTWPLLLAGGTSILDPQFDPATALARIEEHRATCAFMVPTMWRALLRCDGLDDADLSAFNGGVVGGSPCPPALIEAWAARGATLMQGYGMTEAAPAGTLAGPDIAVEHAGSVGVPSRFVQMRLVDEDGRDVAPGQPGEVLFRGPNIMAGYWRDPEATADALRDGWLHTGDIARRDEHGLLYIVGRRSEMIITGGENVYPVEVERVAETMPGVAEAAVFGVPDDEWGEQVCCAIVPEPDAEPSTDEIREFCARSLARYKCPRRALLLDTLPRSGAGKVLRDELREMVRGASEVVQGRGLRKRSRSPNDNIISPK